MKKKLLISLAICMLVIFAFSLCVSAEDTACEHSYDRWTVELGAEGFLGDITATRKCAICNEKETEAIPQLFITLGYSSSSNGVLQGYGINRPAIERYEELSGEKIKFGAVVAIKDTIGDKNPLDANGNPINDYVMSRDYTDTDISIIDVAIKNIPNEAKSSTELLCALYINTAGRTTYIDNCNEKALCGARTFNEIDAGPEPEAPSLDSATIIEGKRYHEMTATELNLVYGYYWNVKSYEGNNSTGTKFYTTKDALTRDQLPNGTIIYVENKEWQYRPNKFVSTGTSTRPSTTKDKYTVIDDSWWADLDGSGEYDKVGFNISYWKGSSIMENVNSLPAVTSYDVDDITEIFKIFVPITYSDENTGDSGNTGDNTGGNTGSEGGSDNDDEAEDDIVIPPSPDYSAIKQNWNDDGELKILAIGNSFSVDAMEYVYQVAKDAGVEKITLGNMFIGGCSLATHLDNAYNNKNAYTFYTNTSGTWSSKGGVSIKTAVESDDWDFITLQQVSGYSGVSDSYDDLVDLINIVEPLNPSARLAWHMTWAYKTGSGHADFSKYNNDQMTMYNAIVDAVNTKILTNDKIEIVIPSGTAVQNVRTSFIGDTTRDGYHLSFGIGRYIASMTYVKALTGLSINNSVTTPDDVDSYELEALIESVNNAISTPYAVTNSTYIKMNGGTGIDDTANAGVIPEGYVQLSATQMGLTFASFYNTTGSSSWEATGDSFARGFMATKKFTRAELPVGSIIEIAAGWQYRPEGWSFATSRPDNVTTLRIVIDEAWWGSYTERGFNISQVAHTTSSHKEITLTTAEVASTIFKIIVPTEVAPDVEEPETPVEPDTPTEGEKVYVSSSDCEETVVVIDGKEYRALTAEAMGFVANAYYYSSNKDAEFFESGTSGTPAKFYATKVFTKEDLPIGAVIWVNSGWQYRPEGWTYTGTRPGNISTTYVTADDAWWGTHTQKGFNISKTNGDSLVGVSEETVYENFKIYIPVDNIIE